MGMYTELFLSVQVKSEYDEVIDILKYMIGEVDTQPDRLPDHPFFAADRWDFMLKCSSFYFVPVAVQSLTYEAINKNWCLITRSDFKHYSNEIPLLMDWLDPYIDALEGEMLGYCRYEEADDPTILRKRADENLP